MLQNQEVELAKLETRATALKESCEQNTAQLDRAQGVQRRREERLNIEEEIKKANWPRLSPDKR